MPKDGKKHLIKRSMLPRTMTANHPSANLPCPHCGGVHAAQSGVLLSKNYTYGMLEQGRALVAIGRGLTYAQVGIALRRDAFCPRLLPRRAAAKREWLPRGVHVRTGPTTKTKDYDYRTPKPAGSLRGPFSRSRSTVAGYIDVFAPAILAAYAPTDLPRVLALDSKPFKRRAWAADEDTGSVSQVSAGERNGEVLLVSDRSSPDSPSVAILAALEGGKDTESWLRALARLPDGPAPFWVVADLDYAIDLAVELKWKTAIRFRCEEHLRRLMRKELVADGISLEVTPAEATRLGVVVKDRTPTKAVRRGTTAKVNHPLHSLINRSLKDVASWEALKVGLNQLIPGTKKPFLPASHIALRTWVADHDMLVMSQFALKAAHPTMPKSAGGVENTLDRIGIGIGKRAEFYANARRLELTVGLMMLEAIGVASEVTYSQIIAKTIAARGGVGIDWQEGRDVLGTSSIDTLIDVAVLAAQDTQDKRQMVRNKASRDQKTVELDIERAAAGLPPTHTGRFHRPNGPAVYYPIEKGQMVSDTPSVSGYWRADLNGGREANQVGAGHGQPANWACDAHGHPHRWTRRVIDMCSHRTTCPFCAHVQPCADTSLATLHKDLAKEWSAKNAPLTPDDVFDGSNRPAFWKCLTCKHEWSARINSRTRQHATCPKCFKARRAKEAAARAAAKKAETRQRLKAMGAVTMPPLLAPGLPPVDPTEASYSLKETARGVHRGPSTVRLWILAGRVRHWTTGNDPKKPIYRIPISEARRIASLLGVVDPADSRPANMSGVNADGNMVGDAASGLDGAVWSDVEGEFSIDSSVAPEERNANEPAA